MWWINKYLWSSCWNSTLNLEMPSNSPVNLEETERAFAGSYTSAPLSPATGTQEVQFLTDENGSFCPFKGPECNSWIHYVPGSVHHIRHTQARLAEFLPYQKTCEDELSLQMLNSLLWDQRFCSFFKIYQNFSPIANEFKTVHRIFLHFPPATG